MSDFYRQPTYGRYSIDIDNVCSEADEDLQSLWYEISDNGFNVSEITTYDDGTPTFKIKCNPTTRDSIMNIINNGHNVIKYTDGNTIVVASMSGDYIANYDEDGYERYPDYEDDYSAPTMQKLLRRGDNLSTWGDDIQTTQY